MLTAVCGDDSANHTNGAGFETAIWGLGEKRTDYGKNFVRQYLRFVTGFIEEI